MENRALSSIDLSPAEPDLSTLLAWSDLLGELAAEALAPAPFAQPQTQTDEARRPAVSARSLRLQDLRLWVLKHCIQRTQEAGEEVHRRALSQADAIGAAARGQA